MRRCAVKVKVSLIMATYGRHDECNLFLKSLENQEYKDFEVIVVDQNPVGYLDDIINNYKDKFVIKYVHLNKKGLSHARNIGLAKATGSIVAFPDDDCEYFSDTLQKVVTEFNYTHADIISGRIVHKKDIRTENGYTKINKYNIWKKSISITIFMKNSKLGLFDEKLGVGSGTKYGSGEETDYLLTELEKGKTMMNCLSIAIFHPIEKISNYGKAYDYSVGRMYVLHKHNYPTWFILANMIYPLVKMFRYFYDPIKLKYLLYQFKGRI